MATPLTDNYQIPHFPFLPEGKKECCSKPSNKEGNSKVVCYHVAAEKMHICHRQSSHAPISKQQGNRETTLNSFWNLNEINLPSVGLQFNYNQPKPLIYSKLKSSLQSFWLLFYANHKHCKLTFCNRRQIELLLTKSTASLLTIPVFISLSFIYHSSKAMWDIFFNVK